MSDLIYQTELNDCGPAVCTMVLKSFQKDYSLEEFKVANKYNHQQYSFADISYFLKKYGIKSIAYEFTSLDELRSLKQFACFQIINEAGLDHFILAKYWNNHRWLILDSAKKRPFLLSEKKFITITTKQVQVYKQSLVIQKEKQIRFLKETFFVIKHDFLGILLANLLLIMNLSLTILLNSFLRILFQDYQYLSWTNASYLFLGLTLLILANLFLDFLIKLVNKHFLNLLFSKILKQDYFQKKFYDAINYLYKNDFEKIYFEFQNNLLILVNVLHSFLGLLIFICYLGIYFFQVNQVLMISSAFLVSIILLLKYFKTKSTSLKNKNNQLQENYYFYELSLLIKNQSVIKNKTELKNYLEVKKINHLYNFKNKISLEKFVSLERWVIYLYYLILCLLLNWQELSISALIIFTSITLVLTGQLEIFVNGFLTFKKYNYFNVCLQPEKKLKNENSKFVIFYKEKKVKENFLVTKTNDLEFIYLNYLPINKFRNQIYYANEAINFDDNLYHNIFNYYVIDLKLVQDGKINELIEEHDLSLEQKPNLENQAIVKYLSCFFTKRRIVIVNDPKNKFLKTQLVNLFPEKVFIFLDDEV